MSDKRYMRAPDPMQADPGVNVGGQFFRFIDAPDGTGVKVVELPEAGEYEDPLQRLGFSTYAPAVPQGEEPQA